MTRDLFARLGRRSLGGQIAFNLLTLGLLGLAAILLLLSAIIDQRFKRLEEHEVAGHLDRAEAMFESMKHTAEARTLDWAVWNDSFDYLRAPNSDYETTNFSASAFQNIDAEAMGFVRFDGSFEKAVYYDLKAARADTAAQAEFARIIAAPEFRKAMREKKTRLGFVRFGKRVLVVAAAQIFRSDGSGPAAGYLVTGKEVRDADIVQALQLPAKLEPTAGSAPVNIRRNKDQITIAKRIQALGGEPIATVRFVVRRSLVREGATLLWLTAGGVAVLLIAIIALLNWRLRTILIRPIQTFQAHVSRISHTGELVAFAERRNDELGELYREFNAMADELNSLRAKVEAQSFAVGQNESVIAIMHNVRNAISPVHAILSKLDDGMKFPAEANVRRVLDELLADTALAERRRQLIAFLDAAVGRARDDLVNHRGDMREALRGLGQVVEAISNAQISAKAQSLAAECDLSTIVGSSLGIVRHQGALDISTNFATDERFRLAAPRVLLAQVIDNLLTNAVEAIAATGREEGTIAIHASRDPVAPDRLVRLTIRDDGDGFAPARAAELFERGKSSRQKDTVGGIGLHWCANTLNALGGAIEIFSEGPGRGAVVTLRLPIATDIAMRPAEAA